MRNLFDSILASIGFKSVVTSLWTDIGAGIGIFGIFIVLIFWLWRGKPTPIQSMPATLSIKHGNDSVLAQNIDPKEAISALREVMQNRGGLPTPDGEVIVTDGANKELVRAYSDEEKIKNKERLETKMQEHDKNLLAQINDYLQTGVNNQAEKIEPNEFSLTHLTTKEERTLVMPESSLSSIPQQKNNKEQASYPNDF